MTPPAAAADTNGTSSVGDGPHQRLDAANSVPNTGAPPMPPWSVQSVLSSISSPPPPNPTSPLPFFHLLERLKTTKREGWRRFGIKHGESISDHMYRMSIITMLAPPSFSSRLNVPHCTKMALIHDMAESLVGDITPKDDVEKPEKNRREAESMTFLSNGLLGKVAGGAQGQELKLIWEEYEKNETLESKFVHDVDKLELLLQMNEYERSGGGDLDLGEFTWVGKRVELAEMKVWCEELLAERRAFWSGLGKSASHLDMDTEDTPDPFTEQTGSENP